jgi:hypothetical protein
MRGAVGSITLHAAGVGNGISAILKIATFLFGAPAFGIMVGMTAGWAGGGSSLERGISILDRSILTLIPTSRPTW